MGKTSKEQLKGSDECFDIAGIGYKKMWEGIKATPRTLRNTIKGIGLKLDGRDKKIGEGIERKKKNKGKDTTGNVKRFFRNNILKVFLGTAIVGGGIYGGIKIYDRNNENKELSMNDDEKANIQSTVVEDLQYIEQGVKLLRDGPLTFYVVKDNEGLNDIKNKLQEIPEFSYLADPIYNIPSDGSRNISSFNTPNSSIKEGFFLPIPIKIEDRQIELDKFKDAAKEALSLMKKSEIYGEKTKELLKKIPEKDVIAIMAAYARSETACDYKEFKDQIGTVELHRREKKYKAYSFSYFHILMEKNADGKTPGPGLKARLKLKLTEGDCYDPINACKLLLGYCFEKNTDPTYFFNINSLRDAKTVGGTYNGDSSYGNKLWANIKYCKDN